MGSDASGLSSRVWHRFKRRVNNNNKDHESRINNMDMVFAVGEAGGIVVFLMV